MIGVRGSKLIEPLRASPARIATRGIEALAAALMGVIVILVLANALGRYLFSNPLPWSEEVVMISMIWVASVGILLGTLRGSLICCDVLVMRLPPRMQRGLAIICGILGGLALGFFAWQIGAYIRLFGNDLSPVLRLPKGIGVAALWLCMAGMAAVLMFRACKLFVGGPAR